MEAATRERVICGAICLASPIAFYALIRLLPNVLTTSDGGVLVRQIALLVIPVAWLVWLAMRSPLSSEALGLSRPK